MIKKSQSLFLVITSILLISLLFANTSIYTRSVWEIDDDTSVSYEIEEASWGIQIGDSSYIGSGANFGDVKVDQLSTFDVEVLAVDDEYGIEFSVDNSTSSTTGSISTDLFLYEFTQFLYYPEQEALRLSMQGLNAQAFEHGPQMSSWFFVEPEESLWDYLTEITDIEFHKTRDNNYDYEAYFEADFEIRENQALFDMYMYGSFVNETQDVDMDFNHNIKFIWDSLNGILLGYRISTRVSGNINDVIISETMVIVCSETSYSLPGFKFYNYSGLISSFGIPLTIIGLSVIVITGFLLKRNKNK